MIDAIKDVGRGEEFKERVRAINREEARRDRARRRRSDREAAMRVNR
jgi:hypothetical protein